MLISITKEMPFNPPENANGRPYDYITLRRRVFLSPPHIHWNAQVHDMAIVSPRRRSLRRLLHPSGGSFSRRSILRPRRAQGLERDQRARRSRPAGTVNAIVVAAALLVHHRRRPTPGARPPGRLSAAPRPRRVRAAARRARAARVGARGQRRPQRDGNGRAAVRQRHRHGAAQAPHRAEVRRAARLRREDVGPGGRRLQLREPAPRHAALGARPQAHLVDVGERARGDRAPRVEPERQQAPLGGGAEAARAHAGPRPRPRPQLRERGGEVLEDVLVGAALHGVVPPVEAVRPLEREVQHHDQAHQRHGGDEVPLDGRVAGAAGLEGVHVHAEEAADEGQGKEDECDPG